MQLILGNDVPIYGGLTPVNSSLVDKVPSEIETIFFTEYSYGIVQSAQYVIGIDPITNCGGGSCTSIFLPGGVEMARLRADGLNRTLFDGETTLANADVIVISGAPGYQLEFYEPENYAFDPGDCSTYGLDQGEGWHICIGSENSTIFAGKYLLNFPELGWSVCPTILFATDSCGANLSWTNSTDQIIAMNAFKRTSTTAYSSQNLSILTLESISAPETYEPNVTAFRKGLDAVLTGDSNVTSAYLTAAGWFLRLYQDEFKNDTGSPIRLLQGLLIVPQQFTVNAWQYANASQAAKDPNSTTYALPPDLRATAAAAQYQYRAIAKYPATVYTFMVIGSSLLVCWASFVCFVVRSRVDVPHASQFPEIDLSSRSGHPSIPNLPNGASNVLDYTSKMRLARLSNARSSQIIDGTQNMVIRFVEMTHESGESYGVFVVGDSKELVRSLGSNPIHFEE